MKIKLTIGQKIIIGKSILLAGVLGLFLVPAQSYATDPAPCGPPPGGEGPCNNCLTTNAWTLDFCPSQTNSSSVSPTVLCNKVGDAPTEPTVIVPVYQSGQKETHDDYACSNSVYRYDSISYNVSSYMWDPPLPSTFGAGNMPSFSSTAYVNVTSSDTNLCASPGRVDIGGCSWSVVNGAIDAGSYKGNADNGGRTFTVNWRQGLSDIKDASGLSDIFVLSDPTAATYLTYNWWKQSMCCPNGGSGNINKEWYTGSASYNLNGEIDLTVLSVFPQWFQQIIDTLASIDADYAQQLATITGFGHFNVGGKAAVSGDTIIRDPFTDDCYGCSSVYTTGNSKLNISVNDSVVSTLFGGVNVQITGYFNSDLSEYGVAITPPDPSNSMNIYMQDKIKYSLYSYAKVNGWGPGGTYWVGPASRTMPSPAQVVNTVCTSPNL